MLIVANGGGIDKGLLNVQGGGWEHHSPGFFPWTLKGVVCGIVALDEDEIGSTPVVSFRTSAQDGQELGWSASSTIDGVRKKAPIGVPTRVPFLVMLTAVVSAPTIVTVTMSSEGKELAAVPFAVRDSVSDAPPPI